MWNLSLWPLDYIWDRFAETIATLLSLIGVTL